jgi:hypothetical protein
MTITVAVFAITRAPVGGGPHEFGNRRLHQTTLAASHTAEADTVETSPGLRSPGIRAAPTATARSRGAAAGNVYRHCPKLVAKPLPPRNPFQMG